MSKPNKKIPPKAELIIIPKATMDLLLKQKNQSDLIALYNFYYYTAIWQDTNQPKATNQFVAKGLGWGNRRVLRAKKRLKEIGLIEVIKTINPETKRVEQWFVKIKYIWKQETLLKSQQVNHSNKKARGVKTTPLEKSQRCQFQRCHFPQGGFQPTNALSSNSLNALSSNNKLSGAEVRELLKIGQDILKAGVIGRAYKTFGFDKAKDLIEHIKARKDIDSPDAYALAICRSGILPKPKPYFENQPMLKKDGRWLVKCSDGQLREFAGSEKDIEWR